MWTLFLDEIVSMRKIQFNNAALIREVQQNAQRGVERAGQLLLSTYEKMLNQPGVRPKGGRRLGKPSLLGPGFFLNRGRSLPGESPHYETRDLLISLHMIPDGKLQVNVGTPLDYGLFLEYGVPHIGRKSRKSKKRTFAMYQLKPRPWLRPGYGKVADKIQSILRTAVGKSF